VQSVQPKEKPVDEVYAHVIDISRSGQDPPTKPKLASCPRNNKNRSFMAKWYGCGYHFSNHPYPTPELQAGHFFQAGLPSLIRLAG